MSKDKRILKFLFGMALLLVGCQETVIYDVGTLSPNALSDKKNLKDDLQFTTIAYRDLFDAEIPPASLETIRKAYVSFGDKELIVDEIVQALLLSEQLNLPSVLDIQADREAFIIAAYKRFLQRQPSDFEIAFWESQLKNNPNLTAADIYYVFMTSEEYKYY